MSRFKNKSSIPKPFSRPSIEAGTQVGRCWKEIEVKDLKPGDIVAGMGLVREILPTCGDDMLIDAGEHVDNFLPSHQLVLAFVRKVN